jgi:hypothetical protein
MVDFAAIKKENIDCVSSIVEKAVHEHSSKVNHQLNLSSESARKSLTSEIVDVLVEGGWIKFTVNTSRRNT